MAQLVERSLLIPEVRGSTPVIGKIYTEHLFVYYQLYLKDEKKFILVFSTWLTDNEISQF